ncbi:hypothetical protein LXP96_003274 [Escherichia coli]|nr:hypothetical protein [Escherichia coli]
MVTLKAHILPHHDLQPPGCRGSAERKSHLPERFLASSLATHSYMAAARAA